MTDGYNECIMKAEMKATNGPRMARKNTPRLKFDKKAAALL
jgi:hypothetical protein